MLVRSRILVVEDDLDVVQALSRVLRKDGHETVVETSAEDALKQLHGGGEFDLVLLDLGLPGAHGSVLLREIREHHAELPVVVLSGTPDLDDVIHAFRIGAIDFVRKPFTPDSVLKAVNPVLRREKDRNDSSQHRDAEAQGKARGRDGQRPWLDATLSRREVEVAEATVEHGDCNAVARRLHISPHTVRNHLKSIYAKLDIHSRSELVKVFMGAGARH